MTTYDLFNKERNQMTYQILDILVESVCRKTHYQITFLSSLIILNVDHAQKIEGVTVRMQKLRTAKS
jgi:hypothetical protein